LEVEICSEVGEVYDELGGVDGGWVNKEYVRLSAEKSGF
jgi:hypothetical protein